MRFVTWGIVCGLFICSGVALSADPWSARGRGLSDITATLRGDPSCLATNPAGLAGIRFNAVSASFVPAHFGLSELKTHIITAAMPIARATGGLGFRSFGFKLFRETSLIVAAGLPLNDHSVGAALEFRQYSFSGYGAGGVLLVNAGFQSEIGEMLTVGGGLRNALNASLGRARERLPRSMYVGMSVSPIPATVLAMEFELDPGLPQQWKAGMEIQPHESISLRMGCNSNPATWSAGVGVMLSTIGFSYGGTSHGTLGWTHQIEIIVRWGS